MLQSFIPLFCVAADRMVETINKHNTDGISFNILHCLEKCVVELVCAATFDVHLAEREDGEAIVSKIIETTNM